MMTIIIIIMVFLQLFFLNRPEALLPFYSSFEIGWTIKMSFKNQFTQLFRCIQILMTWSSKLPFQFVASAACSHHSNNFSSQWGFWKLSKGLRHNLHCLIYPWKYVRNKSLFFRWFQILYSCTYSTATAYIHTCSIHCYSAKTLYLNIISFLCSLSSCNNSKLEAYT